MIRCTAASAARLRTGWEDQTFENEGGDGARGVHDDVEGIEGATEQGNAEVLKELDGRTEEDDRGGAEGWTLKTRRTLQPHPEQQDE